MFLTKEEVTQLTGYVRSSDQCRWLKKRAWKFEVSGIGRPVVLRKHVEEMLSIAAAKKDSVEPAWTPNIDAIRKKV